LIMPFGIIMMGKSPVYFKAWFAESMAINLK